jgi:hypothetical protein
LLMHLEDSTMKKGKHRERERKNAWK